MRETILQESQNFSFPVPGVPGVPGVLEVSADLVNKRWSLWECNIRTVPGHSPGFPIPGDSPVFLNVDLHVSADLVNK